MHAALKATKAYFPVFRADDVVLRCPVPGKEAWASIQPEDWLTIIPACHYEVGIFIKEERQPFATATLHILTGEKRKGVMHWTGDPDYLEDKHKIERPKNYGVCLNRLSLHIN